MEYEDKWINEENETLLLVLTDTSTDRSSYIEMIIYVKKGSFYF